VTVHWSPVATLPAKVSAAAEKTMSTAPESLALMLRVTATAISCCRRSGVLPAGVLVDALPLRTKPLALLVTLSSGALAGPVTAAEKPGTWAI